MRHGYCSDAVELLARYFEGQLTPISELVVDEVPENTQVRLTEAAEKASLLEEDIKPRTDLPPLLVPLRERRPEKLHYLEVSFGLTLDLFKFWRKHNFAPFYIGRVPRSETGELTCMVLKPLNNDDIETSGSDQLGFFSQFYQEFKKMFTTYLGRPTFRQMEYNLAMSILEPKMEFLDMGSSSESLNSISEMPSFSMEHLEAYTNNDADYCMTEHFVGDLACAYFWGKIPVSMSKVKASVLVCKEKISPALRKR